MKNAILTICLTALIVLPACKTMDGLGSDLAPVLPASQESVTELRAHVDAQDAAIRTDVVAARTAGEAAYGQAIAEGKSEMDARAAALAAEIGKAKADAEASAAKAKDAADNAQGEGIGWEEMVSAGIAVLLSYFGVNLTRNRSRKKALASVKAGGDGKAVVV